MHLRTRLGVDAVKPNALMLKEQTPHPPRGSVGNPTHRNALYRGPLALTRCPETRHLDNVCWRAGKGPPARSGTSFGVGRGCPLGPNLPLSQDSRHPLSGRSTDLWKFSHHNGAADPAPFSTGRSTPTYHQNPTWGSCRGLHPSVPWLAHAFSSEGVVGNT